MGASRVEREERGEKSARSTRSARPSNAAKPHGTHYALFKTELLYRHKLDMPDDADAVVIRTADFARRSPKIAKQLKAYLESPDRNDPDLAKRLPEIIAKLRPEQLRVCELAYQMSLWELPQGKDLKPTVPFQSPEHPKFTFIDLFAGIGGFHLAMHSLGGRCVFASEWDKEAQKTYEANYGIAPVNLGYRLTPEPLIVSPHFFGVPQLRERVVVLGIYDPAHSALPLEISLPTPKRKEECRLDDILEPDNHDPAYALTREETDAINTWDEFYHGIQEKVIGFPIWFDWFKTPPPNDEKEMPEWKQSFVRKNNQLYQNNKIFIDGWSRRHEDLHTFTPTMRKMEWQCGESVASAWDAFMQMRPSGLRIKRPDCDPDLVAIVQVPIIGKYHRRMTVREAARLQSFPDAFIPNPDRHEAYKQFGNAA